MSQALAYSVVALLVGACLFQGPTVVAGPATPPSMESGPRPVVKVTYPSGVRIVAELADTPQTRARGLMFRDKLATDSGMLFVFEEAGQWAFWMKNTKVPLDILWIAPDKRIVYIEENIQGCTQDPCPEYQSNKDALYALELPAGSVKREKLAKGMKLDFDLPK